MTSKTTMRSVTFGPLVKYFATFFFQPHSTPVTADLLHTSLCGCVKTSKPTRSWMKVIFLGLYYGEWRVAVSAFVLLSPCWLILVTVLLVG